MSAICFSNRPLTHLIRRQLPRSTTVLPLERRQVEGVLVDELLLRGQTRTGGHAEAAIQ